MEINILCGTYVFICELSPLYPFVDFTTLATSRALDRGIKMQKRRRAAEFRSRNVRNKTKMPRNKTNTKKAHRAHTHRYTRTHEEDVNDAANSLTTHIHTCIRIGDPMEMPGGLPAKP